VRKAEDFELRSNVESR